MDPTYIPPSRNPPDSAQTFNQTSHNVLISCSKCAPESEWSNSFHGCDRALDEGASKCWCHDFYHRYMYIQHHKFGEGRQTERFIVNSKEDVADEIGLKVVGNGSFLNLELSHVDGRGCTIVVEPRTVDEVCLSWPSLALDLARFTRVHKLEKITNRHCMIFIEDH